MLVLPSPDLSEASRSWFLLPRIRSVLVRSRSVRSPQLAILLSEPSRPITVGPRWSREMAWPFTSTWVVRWWVWSGVVGMSDGAGRGRYGPACDDGIAAGVGVEWISGAVPVVVLLADAGAGCAGGVCCWGASASAWCCAWAIFSILFLTFLTFWWCYCLMLILWAN